MAWESNYHTAGMLKDVPLGDLDAAFGNCLAFAKLCASVELWNLLEGKNLELKNDTTIVDFNFLLLLQIVKSSIIHLNSIPGCSGGSRTSIGF